MDFLSKEPPLEENFVRHRHILSIDAYSLKEMTKEEITLFLFNFFGIAYLLVDKIYDEEDGAIWYYYIDLPIVES